MDILTRIRARKEDEVATRKEQTSQSEIESLAQAAPEVRPFAEALSVATPEGYGLIAEIKKASPSRGVIRADFDPPVLAQAYAEGGATCLSVLTDGPGFQGADDYLVAAREAVELPVLRKDFLIDPWQVAESRALGADCILIIMAMVTDEEARALADAATRWGMDALVEVHDEEELRRAEQIQPRMIGINNRNLKTFETDLDVTRQLARRVPPDSLIVAESGLSTPEDLADLARYGARSFLIGESLMRADDVAAATRALLADPYRAPGAF